MRTVKPKCIFEHVVVVAPTYVRWEVCFNGLFWASLSRRNMGRATFRIHGGAHNHAYIYWNRNTLEIKIV